LTFEQLLDSDEAAALLKIHPKTLQKMVVMVRLVRRDKPAWSRG